RSGRPGAVTTLLPAEGGSPAAPATRPAVLLAPGGRLVAVLPGAKRIPGPSRSGAVVPVPGGWKDPRCRPASRPAGCPGQRGPRAETVAHGRRDPSASRFLFLGALGPAVLVQCPATGKDAGRLGSEAARGGNSRGHRLAPGETLATPRLRVFAAAALWSDLTIGLSGTVSRIR